MRIPALFCPVTLIMITLGALAPFASAATASSSSSSGEGTAVVTGIDANGDLAFSMGFDALEKCACFTAGHLKVYYLEEGYSGSANGSISIQPNQSGTSIMGALTVASQNGTLTVTFQKQVFTLTSQATQVNFGGKTYTLGTSDTVARIAKDGTVTIIQTPAAAAKP